MDQESAVSVAEDGAVFSICREHRMSHGLPFPGGTCDTRCGYHQNHEDVKCPEGCSVMDTCPVIGFSVHVLLTERQLSEWDKTVMDELRRAKGGDRDGVGQDLLDDLALLEEAQRHVKPKQRKVDLPMAVGQGSL